MKNYIIKIFLNLKHILDKIKHNKILLYTLCTCILVLFCLALNFAFSSFTHTASNIAANIKVKDMTFSMSINGTATTLLTASSNNITKANIILTSTNSMAAKY